MAENQFDISFELSEIDDMFAKSLSSTKTKKIRDMKLGKSETEKEKKDREEMMKNYREKVFTDYQQEIMKWTELKKFEHVKTILKSEMSKEKFVNTIVGKKNIIVIFVTKTMCSFGIYESAEIPQVPTKVLLFKTPEKAYSNGPGRCCIFSLDNYNSISFKLEKANEGKARNFVAIYSSDKFAMEVNNFGYLGIHGDFGFCNFEKQMLPHYDAYSIEGQVSFVGNTLETIELDSILIYQGFP